MLKVEKITLSITFGLTYFRSILAANGSFIKQDSVVSRGLKADLTAKRLFCTTRSQSSQEEKLEKPKGVGSSRGGITKKEAGKGTI